MSKETRGGARWDRHQQLVRAIERFKVKHDMYPTMTDLAPVLKVSVQATHMRLQRAHASGYVGKRLGTAEAHGTRGVWRWYATAAGKELL